MGIQDDARTGGELTASPVNVGGSGSSGGPRPYKCIVLGCTPVAEEQYIPAIKALGNIEVVALVDPRPSRLDALHAYLPAAHTFGPALDIGWRDYAPCWRGSVDFVVITSPAARVAEQAIIALQSGMHVLCEKPMAVWPTEAEAMIDIAKQVGRTLAVGSCRRFFPATRTISDYIFNGDLGKVSRYAISERAQGDRPAPAVGARTPRPGARELLMELGWQPLDLARLWFGAPMSVGLEYESNDEIGASCHLRLKHDRGVNGEIRLCQGQESDIRYHLEFEQGWLAWSPNEPRRLEIGLHDGGYARDVNLPWPGADGDDRCAGHPEGPLLQSYMDQLSDFIESAAAGTPPRVPGSDGLAALRLIDRCCRNTEAAT